MPHSMDVKTLEYLIDHIGFPLKLPQGDEGAFKLTGNAELSQFVLSTCQEFRDTIGTEHYQTWASIHRLLNHFRHLHVEDSLTKDDLKDAFIDVGQGSILVVHVAMQNAGLIIRKHNDEYHFETFEVSAQAEKVLASSGALQMEFPTSAAAIPASIFETTTFPDEIAKFLEKASVEDLKQFSAIATKAGQRVAEIRDTPKPTLITDLLMAILEANGRYNMPDKTRKRIQDDVCWSNGSEMPWRRSSSWLVLRVGIQRALCFLQGGEIGLVHYKFFMAFLLQRICEEASKSELVASDRLAFLKTKLARRLAKLQSQRDNAVESLQTHYDLMFKLYAGTFHKTLDLANEVLSKRWSNIRAQTIKKVPNLKRWAPTEDLVMSLVHSGACLDKICAQTLDPASSEEIHLEEHLRIKLSDAPSIKINLPTGNELHDYIDYAEFERWAKQFTTPDSEALLGGESSCIQLQRIISSYLPAAKSAYKGDPVQLSMMVLTIMELWVCMDREVIDLFPLLVEYPLDFPDNIFHTLQLPRRADMLRLQAIEKYLDNRREHYKTHLTSPFAYPAYANDELKPSDLGRMGKNSFGVRYFDSQAAMQTLLAKIRTDTEVARKAKKSEWERLSEEHARLMTEARGTSCVQDPENPGQCWTSRCTKHYQLRRAKRMVISVHEDAIPSDPTAAKAIVFELLCPRAYQAWRDTTWIILRELSRSQPVKGNKSEATLSTDAKLSSHKKTADSIITLGSSTKAWTATHYKPSKFPVTLDQICRLSGLKFSLFDKDRSIWVTDQKETPSFAEMCRPAMPSDSPFLSVATSLHPVTGVFGKTSNEAVAKQMECPTSLTISEFSTFQELRLGHHLQWVRLLKELTTPLFDFGNPACSMLITQLVLQVGPSGGTDPLRIAHWSLAEADFCHELVSQIDRRLQAIGTNWRETHALHTYTTVLLRIRSITTVEKAKTYADGVLQQIRKLSLTWTWNMFHEVRQASDPRVAQLRAQDTVSASLLCRKTFAVEAEDEDHLSAEDLSIFVQSSILLNLTTTEPFSKLPTQMRQQFISDIKMVHKLESILRHAFTCHGNQALGAAVGKFWPQSEGEPERAWEPWQFLSGRQNMWITSKTIPSSVSMAQEVHYNMLRGSLLIHGRSLGKLPSTYVSAHFYQQLFGDRMFWAVSSNIPGCIYMAASTVEGHTIHFGLRDEIPFLRARRDATLFEYVPSEVFSGPNSASISDLPQPLITSHIHWLDLRNGIVEVRPLKDAWRSKISNWKLHLGTRQMMRRQSLLIDPRSSTFSRLVAVIEPFQDQSQLIVYQPPHSSLSIQLPEIDLSFRTNSNGLLESQQLRAEIDSDQDAGILYGFNSKLVLRDIRDPQNRSILVAQGDPTFKRVGEHIYTTIANPKQYCRMPLNKVLGRLECPAGSVILYMKAFYHAITSFVLPDPLTKRTGVEEAIHCLESGCAQPWTPLDEASQQMLKRIALLTPRRAYYPADMKVMQTTTISTFFTQSVQHESFRSLVESIWSKSENLLQYYTEVGTDGKQVKLQAFSKLEGGGPAHLLQRARQRSLKYQACGLSLKPESLPDDYYAARSLNSSTEYGNAYELTSLLKNWSTQIDVHQNLIGFLQSQPSIIGFRDVLEIPLLHDVLTLDVALQWGPLFEMCKSKGRTKNAFDLMFFFAVLAYNKNADATIVRTLLAFCILERFHTMVGPLSPSFGEFKSRERPTEDTLVALMSAARRPYSEDESDGNRSRHRHWPRVIIRDTARQRHEENSLEEARQFSRHIQSQWPSLTLKDELEKELPLLDRVQALDAVRLEWERRVNNFELAKFIRNLQHELQNCSAIFRHKPGTRTGCDKYFAESQHYEILPSLQEILATTSNDTKILSEVQLPFTTSLLPPSESKNLPGEGRIPGQETAEVSELRNIVRAFEKSENAIQRQYAADLHLSMDSFLAQTPGPRTMLPSNLSAVTLQEAVNKSKDALNKGFLLACEALSQDSRFAWLKSSRLWPQLTPVTLLETLRHSAGLPQNPYILRYALLMRNFQQLLRFQSAFGRNNRSQIEEELKTYMQDLWSTEKFPDWLLLEIEFNIRIRPIQYEVATAMLCPASGVNSVLQMNMGQGKSSVIIPMIAAVLADKNQLVRVVVTRPLLLQMAQLLTARLGGLIGRPIMHVPFSRRSSTKPHDVQAYLDLHKSMLDSQGIVLVLPEHLLSFKLSGLQMVSNGKMDNATFMTNAQSWLEKHARDVLDECDQSLAVRTQLIYPSGSQHLVDGHPHRWITVQLVLQLVKRHISELARELPQCIELIESRDGGMPRIFILRPEINPILIDRITQDMLYDYRNILPTKNGTSVELQLAESLLRQPKLDSDCFNGLSAFLRDRSSLAQQTLLLRGLLLHGLLLTAINKRFNVQYGLHPDRDPVAVPFQAKGVPSERAEFGHPDVAILLTCLSFYYQGLTYEQFQKSILHLSKADEPSSEYAFWVEQSPKTPLSLRSWSAVNVDDHFQCQELWGVMRYNMSTINFFLNYSVFPRHAKVFEKKLVSSGWDIPLPTPGLSNGNAVPRGEDVETSALVRKDDEMSLSKPARSTGFSGTNDNRYLLPMNIRQQDLPQLASTNAEVLTYLLLPRNRIYFKAADYRGKRFSEEELLKSIHQQGIRMLLDSGAQILEMDNFTVCQTWLRIDHEAEGAMYFDAKGEMCILHRDGRMSKLAASPFLDNFEKCLVYLDESHTRGTDLKMPANAVAALTLGPGQTKDHTVQAAMRLRQLGTSQAVVFFAPPEVDQNIRDVRSAYEPSIPFSNPVNSSDVVRWLLEQTCLNIEQLYPLYISQGMDYCQRSLAAHKFPELLANSVQRQAYLQVLEQREDHSLENMYAPAQSQTSKALNTSDHVEFGDYIRRLDQLKNFLRHVDFSLTTSTFTEVEQEREQEQEQELIREIQKPPSATPHKQLPVHRDVVYFAEHGDLVAASAAYEQAFIMLRRTALGKKYGINDSATKSNLFVTTDFRKTILNEDPPRDEYQRHVTFFLWSPARETALVISPPESEALLCRVRDAVSPQTHMILYTAPITRDMLIFNNMDLSIIPSLPGWKAPNWLKKDLGIFAGRLYFEIDEYPAICDMLGFDSSVDTSVTDKAENTKPSTASASGKETAKPNRKQTKPFSPNARLFLQEWLAIRRNGQDFSRTPMGNLCQGRRLHANSAFFKKEAVAEENA